VRELIHGSLPLPGRLYAGPRPAWPFESSVAALVDHGITTIACLLEPGEFPADLRNAYEEVGLKLLWFPVADFEPPRDAAAFAVFLQVLVTRLESGENLYVHCLGGIGRTGTLLGCLFKLLGETGDPIKLVRSIYARSAVESPAQLRFVKDFDARSFK
jgi:protein-tyrosine phosphatase